MLSKRDKELIRTIGIHYYTRIGESFLEPIPSYQELKEQSKFMLKKNGFTVTETNRFNANCIIRMYKNPSEQYDGDDYRFYGFHCFTKKNLIGNWYSTSESTREFVYDPERFTSRIWYCQDEYHDFTLFEFKDLYVKISKISPDN